MRHVLEIGVSGAVASALFGIAAWWTDPPPIASFTGLIGGLLGFWLVRARNRLAPLLGGLLGAIGGIALHVRSHVVEERVGTFGGLARHAVVDGLLGVAIAGSILIAALWVTRFVAAPRRRAGSGSPERDRG